MNELDTEYISISTIKLLNSFDNLLLDSVSKSSVPITFGYNKKNNIILVDIINESNEYMAKISLGKFRILSLATNTKELGKFKLDINDTNNLEHKPLLEKISNALSCLDDNFLDKLYRSKEPLSFSLSNESENQVEVIFNKVNGKYSYDIYID